MTDKGLPLSEVFTTDNMSKYELATENARLRERVRVLEYWLEYVVNSSLVNPDVEKSARAVLDEGIL